MAGVSVVGFLEHCVRVQEETQAGEIAQHQARLDLAASDFDAPPAGLGARKFETYYGELPGVFRMRVYDRTGRIIWSNENKLIGMRLPDNPHVRAALGGRVMTVFAPPKLTESLHESNRAYVAQTYIPIVFGAGSDPVGVVETYRDMSVLMQGVRRTQLWIWAVGGVMGLFLYAALAMVVWTASASERRAMKQLEEQNRELTLLQRF